MIATNLVVLAIAAIRIPIPVGGGEGTPPEFSPAIIACAVGFLFGVIAVGMLEVPGILAGFVVPLGGSILGCLAGFAIALAVVQIVPVFPLFLLYVLLHVAAIVGAVGAVWLRKRWLAS